VSINSIEYLLLGLLAFVLAGFLTWPVRKIAIGIGAMDSPNLDRKTQKEPIPYLGGVAIAASIVILTFAAVIKSNNTQATFPLAAMLLFPAIFLGAVGLVDDLRTLQPMPRLIIQTVTAIVVSLFLINTDTVAINFDSTIIDEVIMVFWIIGICNSINFFDNLDGGAAGTVAVSSLGIAAIALGEGQELVAALSIVTAGSTLGFLMWNKSPAKIYMGDAGALFLGIIISVATIRLNPGIEPTWKSLTIPVILLAVPLLDTCVAVFTRLARGISPLTGGKDHLSHRLVRAGLSRRVAAVSLWSASGVCAVVAIAVYLYPDSFGTLLISIFAAGWLAALTLFLRTPSQD
jgi:UDP-GlcNAc:undecaprenyl-phosphate GlcNAc-1-phosphate transferase